jgi:hypothetical protein
LIFTKAESFAALAHIIGSMPLVSFSNAEHIENLNSFIRKLAEWLGSPTMNELAESVLSGEQVATIRGEPTDDDGLRLRANTVLPLDGSVRVMSRILSSYREPQQAEGPSESMVTIH